MILMAFPIWGFGQVSVDELYENLDELVSNYSEENLKRFEATTKTFSKDIYNKESRIALIIANCNLGYYFKKQGNQSKSIVFYETAYNDFEKHQLDTYDIYENGVVPLSTLYIQQGNYLKAEELLKKCLAHSENIRNNSLLFNAVLSLSALYNSTSRYEASVQLINAVLNTKRVPLKTWASLNNNLATAYIGMGGFDKAKDVLLKITESVDANHVNAYKNLAFIALKEIQHKKATQFFDKARNALLQNPNATANEWTNLQIEEAVLFLESNQPEIALISLQKALSLLLPSYSGKNLPSKSAIYPNRNFLRLFDMYAAMLDSTEDVLAAYDLAFHTSELLQWSYISQETKILHQAEVKNRTEKCLALLWQRYSETNDNKWAEMAFQYSEKNKSAVLQEQVALTSESSKNLVYRDLQRSLQKREQLTDQLLRAQFKNLSSETINEISHKLKVLDQNIKKLHDKISKKEKRKVPIADVKDQLKKDDAVLQSYFMGNESAYQFTITDSILNMVRLSEPEELTPILLDFVHLFDSPEAINNDVLNFTKSAYSVFEALQIKNNLSKENLVIIPDGILNFMPFESLLTNKTDGTSFSKMPFLVIKHKVSYALNAQNYLMRESEMKDNSVLGVFPVFKGSPDELTYSLQEAKALENNMHSERLMEAKATKSSFIQKAKKHSILHLSTHAAGGDFIVPAHIKFYDDLLYLPELHSLDMKDKTIILSACETGIGKIQKGEGALSIARGFQYAGASKVLFSLWKVNDQSTASIMERFYKSFQKTSSVFESSHIAKLSYLNDLEISNSKKSPYYWNGFAYYGRIEATSAFNYFLLIGMLSLFVLIGLFWFVRKRKS